MKNLKQYSGQRILKERRQCKYSSEAVQWSEDPKREETV